MDVLIALLILVTVAVAVAVLIAWLTGNGLWTVIATAIVVVIMLFSFGALRDLGRGIAPPVPPAPTATPPPYLTPGPTIIPGPQPTPPPGGTLPGCDVSSGINGCGGRLQALKEANGVVNPNGLFLSSGQPVQLTIPAGWTADNWDCFRSSQVTGPVTIQSCQASLRRQ